MDGYETTADLDEQIYYEKLDADLEMAQFEEEGRRAAAAQKKVDAALAVDDLAAAAAACWHGYVGGLTGSCSEGDARYGQDGARCYDCGAHVTGIGGTVVNVR